MNDASKANSAWREHAYAAADLHKMDFPEVNFTVPNILPEGLCILAGRPKVGKSWLALDIAKGVAEDNPVIGNIEPLHGDVLYCALEDNPRRIQRRMHKLSWPPTGKWPSRLMFAHKWRKLDQGGIDDIADWASTVSCPRLAILDTLAGVRPDRNQRDTAYDGDYRALIEAHRLANELAMSILVLTHTRKAEADDPLDAVSGTLGQAGCADTVLILQRGPQGATLYVRGRDIEEAEHAVSFNSDACRWTILGDAAEIKRSDTRKKIIAHLLKATEPKGPKEIADATGLTLAAVKLALPHMLETGEVTQLGRGQYVHPSLDVSI